MQTNHNLEGKRTRLLRALVGWDAVAMIVLSVASSPLAFALSEFVFSGFLPIHAAITTPAVLIKATAICVQFSLFMLFYFAKYKLYSIVKKNLR